MIQVIRALCDKQVYTRLSRIPLDAFEKEPRAIVRALGEAHEKFDHDISPADLKVWFHSKNPGLTKSQRDAYDLLLAKLRDVEPMSPEMVEDVLRDMTRVELGRQIGESGFALMEGTPPASTRCGRCSTCTTPAWQARHRRWSPRIWTRRRCYRR